MSKHKTSEPSFNKYQAKVRRLRYLTEVTWVEHCAVLVHCMIALIIMHETTSTSFFCHYYRSLATLPTNTPTTSSENRWCQQLLASTPLHPLMTQARGGYHFRHKKRTSATYLEFQIKDSNEILDKTISSRYNCVQVNKIWAT
ncbi:hypothetical protein WUBG_05238 [Wuchereria bancrofti]|uniref:Uncharacterized protein n=1 Tax=Wuchereria bancrofti TaxID=6293 RepID=J9F310_WUCBA|nr:hypothetical protein WUBG_05238 [Wuchereria bancrofti]